MLAVSALGGTHNLDEEDLRAVLRCTPGISQETRERDLNLGYGNVYYGLVRLLRPQHILVIGSGFGFSVATLALGLKHNDDGGRLTYVDPLYVFTGGPGGLPTGSRSETTIAERLTCAGAADVVMHFRERNDEFFPRYEARRLPPIDLALIDGGHGTRDVTYDWEGVVARLRLPGYVLLHDSVSFYNAVGIFGVRSLVERVRGVEAEQVTFPGDSGLSLVRVTRRGGLAATNALPHSSFVLLGGCIFGLLAAGYLVGRVVSRRK